MYIDPSMVYFQLLTGTSKQNWSTQMERKPYHQYTCQVFYRWHFLNKISLDWLLTSATQLSISKLTENPAHYTNVSAT